MRPTRITIHCSVTPDGVDVPVERIRRHHMAKPPLGRGFRDIGYHRIIGVAGRVEPGRPILEAGAHVGNMAGDLFDYEGCHDNDGNLGICLIGTQRYTRAQFRALREELDRWCRGEFKIPVWEIRCHNQFRSAQAQKKSCPNMEIGRLLAWYLARDEEAIRLYLHDPAGSAALA